MRPSLADLARRHANRRLSKKRRNAELRELGYDLNGPDGIEYRRLLTAAMENRRYARFVGQTVEEEVLGEMAGPPDLVFLWEVPAAEHAAWLAAGFGAMPRDEYLRRVYAVQAQLQRQGLRVELLPATVAEVEAALAELGQPNTPEGRSAALNLVGLRRIGKEDEGKENGGSEGESD
jgi:hypothetical protein